MLKIFKASTSPKYKIQKLASCSFFVQLPKTVRKSLIHTCGPFDFFPFIEDLEILRSTVMETSSKGHKVIYNLKERTKIFISQYLLRSNGLK